MQTTKEFTGDTAILLIALLVCIPAGIGYYFMEREERLICPSCGQKTRVHADICPSCGNDMGSGHSHGGPGEGGSGHGGPTGDTPGPEDDDFEDDDFDEGGFGGDSGGSGGGGGSE